MVTQKDHDAAIHEMDRLYEIVSVLLPVAQQYLTSQLLIPKQSPEAIASVQLVNNAVTAAMTGDFMEEVSLET